MQLCFFFPKGKPMIYFDNASTSFPKAPGVSDGIKKFLDESCFNINRGTYAGAFAASETVLETRRLLADFFSCKKNRNVVFTGGVTHSLNIVLNGVLEGGDTVLTSSMEHNAVIRPLTKLAKQGAVTEFVKCNADGEIILEDLEKKLKQKPKLLVITHASNICGTIMPIAQIGEMCKQYGVLFAVDAAQTAGVVEINAERDSIDMLCFTGHKGMLAAQGIGGCVFSEQAAKVVKPFVYGGTGSFSDSLEMPPLLPDRFEAGTLNLPGIAGLNRAVTYLNETGIDNIRKKESELQDYFEAGLQEIKTVKTAGAGSKNRCAVTSLNFTEIDNAEASYRLDAEFGIMTRSGLHCAPLAHKTIGTYPKGTVRVAFGHKNTKEEVDVLLGAIKKL